jgi:hypothetical protein
VPVFAFALQLRKNHGKTSVRVAARTSQADTVQYKQTQYITSRHSTSQADTVQYKNNEQIQEQWMFYFLPTNQHRMFYVESPFYST